MNLDFWNRWGDILIHKPQGLCWLSLVTKRQPFQALDGEALCSVLPLNDISQKAPSLHLLLPALHSSASTASANWIDVCTWQTVDSDWKHLLQNILTSGAYNFSSKRKYFLPNVFLAYSPHTPLKKKYWGEKWEDWVEREKGIKKHKLPGTN